MCFKLLTLLPVLASFVLLQLSNATETFEPTDNDYQDQEQELVEGTVEFCMFKYSYTYSKCAHLCHENLDPACVADSLCVCDLNISQVEENATEALLHPETKCFKTAYCDISCREKSLKNQYFTKGYLCDRDSKSTCVCFW